MKFKIKYINILLLTASKHINYEPIPTTNNNTRLYSPFVVLQQQLR